MKLSIVLALALTTIVAVVSGAEAETEKSDVVVITKNNIKEVIGKGSLVFVKFFAPWCSHCKEMADDFKSAATALKGKAVLAEVDATKEQKIAEDYKVAGFPTLKLFSNGKEVTDYQGNRDKESMVKFVERAMLPAYETMENKAAYDKFLVDNADKKVVVGVALDSNAEPKFMKAAYSVRDVVQDIVFVAVKDPSHLGGVSAKKGDVFYATAAKPEERQYEKHNEASFDTLDKFIKTVSLPVFQEFTQNNADTYVELNMPLVVGFFKVNTDPRIPIMEKIAQKKKGNGKVVFAWVDAEKLANFVEYVGLENKDPAICAYDFENDQRYLLPEGFKMSEEALEAWVDDMIAGKISPTRKSQAIPEKNEGPVYTVVGDSWEKEVEDSEKDVLVSQVAPWCGHCKALKPIYEKVAEALAKANIKTVKLASMDATENDAPGEYKAKGFPTMHFFAAGDKQTGVEYDGDRSSKAIIEWLKEHVTHKFEFDTSTLGDDPVTPDEGEGEGEGMEGGHGPEDEDGAPGEGEEVDGPQDGEDADSNNEDTSEGKEDL